MSNSLIDVKRMPLSKLSYIVATDVYSDEEKNLAYEEIKQRFASTTCSSSEFLAREERVFAKRGELLSSYLIGNNPSGQQLMEFYLDRDYDALDESNNVLFSELALCNRDTENSFFVKAAKIELNNIGRRLENFEGSDEELVNLRKAYVELKKRIMLKCDQNNTSLIDYIWDITDGLSVFIDIDKYMEKHGDKIDKAAEELESGKKLALLKLIKPGVVGAVANSETFNSWYIRYFFFLDMARLKPQQKSIITSLKKEQVDYSFLSEDAKLKRVKR